MPLAAATSAPPERLVVVGPEGVIISIVEGESSRVMLEPQIDAILSRPGSNVMLLHNHAIGLGLSASDLIQLIKPGVARVVATGSDGSRYEAERGARFGNRRFPGMQYTIAHNEVIRLFRIARSGGREMPRVDEYIQHVTSMALHKAGVIVYAASLGAERSALWNRYRLVLGPISEAAASRVKEVRIGPD